MRNTYFEHSQRIREITILDPVSRTKQSFKDECDINQIMKKYVKTGMLTHVKNNEGTYADLTTLGNYQENMDQIIRAKALFNSLPAKIRSRFHNSPAEYLEFCTDPENIDEMVKLGLATMRIPENPEPLTPPTTPPPET